MMKNNILRKIIRIMSSILKSIVIIAISSIIVFALVLKVKAIKEGSNMNTKKYTIEEKKEKTLEYMKERYGEEFVGLRWSGKDFFQSYDKFVVYPKRKGEEYEVRVEWIYDEEKKDYDIYDNYMGILIKDKYTDYVTKLVRTKYPTAYVNVKIDSDRTYKGTFTMDTPINEIFDKTGWLFQPTVEITISDLEIKDKNILLCYQELSNMFLKNNLSVWLEIRVCKNEKFNEFILKRGDIYPNDNYSEDIARKYFIKDDRVYTVGYEYTIYIGSDDNNAKKLISSFDLKAINNKK